LRKENQELKIKLNLVLTKLAEKNVKKDSHNSHNPPSHDKYNNRRTSLRKKVVVNPGDNKDIKEQPY